MAPRAAHTFTQSTGTTASPSREPSPSSPANLAQHHPTPAAQAGAYYDPRLLPPGYAYPSYHVPPHYPYPYGALPAASGSTGPLPQDGTGAAAAAAADSTPSTSGGGRKRARTSTPAGGGGGSGSAGKGKKAAAAAAAVRQQDEGSDEEDEDGEIKRKKRLPLSCGECQRRKIKCDRKIPCSACVRRKRTDFCSFEDEDPVSPWALNSEVRALSRRLAHLEGLFQQHAPGVFSQASSASGGALPPPPHAHASPAASLALSSFSAQSHPSPSLAVPHPAPSQPLPSNGATILHPNGDVKQSLSDTEDAVADLEEKTFGARVPVLQALQAAAAAGVGKYNYLTLPSMELLPTLTSILAEPLSYDQDGRPRSAVRLGLDLAVSTADLPAVRHDALSQILAVLPDEAISGFLIGKYFSEMDWDFRVLDPVAFPVEHARYVEMKEQGREDHVDPLWLACFCMVLALSLEGFWSRPHGAKDLSLFHGLSEQDLKDLPSVWHDAALRALQLGEWGGTPRIRTIQCIVLMQQYIQLSSPSGQTGRILTWISSAIRVAQRLGLHKLGSDATKMPPDDPALPPGSNSVKRETGVRLWNMLVNIDSWGSDSPALRSYLLHPSQYTTARPLNLNFRDLSRTDWRTPAPQPLTTYTDASFEIVQCRIGEQIRRALDALVGTAFSYEAVLEQDKAFRQVLDDVPDVFSPLHNPPLQSPRIAYERACLHEDIHSRIVRLHRPLAGRGYSPDSPYRYSTEQCLDAAKKLILGNARLLDIETSRWWMYTGTLASSIVLMMDIFHQLDLEDAPEEDIKEKRDILMQARMIFDSRVATPALTVVVEEGRKILAALFVEEERRRTTRAAHSMASAPPPALETFAQVLKRVSREIAAKEQPNPAALIQPSALNRSIPPAPTLTSASAPFSFAQAAATAMANTPATFGDPAAAAAVVPSFGSADDFSYFEGVANSLDWTAGGFGSPTDETGLFTATW
ncbi:hypothetical protein JCM10213_002095 [Rhodosporidiobolus nylandii]